MLDIFLFAVNAISPIILLILLGYFLKAKNLLDDPFLRTGNKFVFRVALPVKLFYNIYNINSSKELNWITVWYSVATTLLLFILGLITVFLFVKDRKQKGVILQSAFRSNFAIIGIPLAESLGGDVGGAALISAFVVPLYNILAVIALSIFVQKNDDKINWKSILINIVKNPLIIGVFTGLITVAIRALIPLNQEGVTAFTIKTNLPFLYNVLANLAQMASPLALIVLGGQFSFKESGDLRNMIFLGTAWRIILAPIIGIGGAIFLTKHYGHILSWSSYFPTFIALFASPLAASSAIMTREMGSDEQLATQLVVWTSICSIFSVFFIVILLKSLSFLR